MTVAQRKTRVVDADTHFWQPFSAWERYVDAKYRAPVAAFLGEAEASQASELVKKMTEDASGRKYRDIPGSDDPVERLKHMDSEGMDVNIIYPGAGRAAMAPEPDVAAAACRAVNRWNAEFASAAPARLKPTMVLPMRYPEKTVQELRQALQMGLRSAFIAPTPPPERRWSDPALDPVWRELQDAGVVVLFHEFSQLGKGYPGVARPTYRDSYPFMYYCGHTVEMQLALMDLIGGGVMECFPRLQFGFIEAHTAWLPGWLAHMDSLGSWLASSKRGRKGERVLSLLPTEFFRRQCFLASFPDDAWIEETVRYVGEDNVVLCTDFPHPGTAHQMVQTFKTAYPKLPERVQRKLIGENAERIFSLGSYGRSVRIQEAVPPLQRPLGRRAPGRGARPVGQGGWRRSPARWGGPGSGSLPRR